MATKNGPESFGCARCWPSAAEAAWTARRQLTRASELVDEPHFNVLILSCSDCAQRFVSVFTEIIDWSDGDDPQYWTLLPLTEAEADDLAQRGSSLTESHLNTLGAGRRCLRRDHPKDAEPQIFWGTGISVGRHD